VFSETLLDHFESPRNVGEMADANAEAEEENPVCGDRLHLWLRIENGRIQRVSWRAEGCAPAIAAASVTSELLQGMTVERARSLDRETIARALGGLPSRKAHAALLAVSAVRKAVQRYRAGETTKG
jgi:nitrogen fixation NifU-like protein